MSYSDKLRDLISKKETDITKYQEIVIPSRIDNDWVIRDFIILAIDNKLPISIIQLLYSKIVNTDRYSLYESSIHLMIYNHVRHNTYTIDDMVTTFKNKELTRDALRTVPRSSNCFNYDIYCATQKVISQYESKLRLIEREEAIKPYPVKLKTLKDEEVNQKVFDALVTLMQLRNTDLIRYQKIIKTTRNNDYLDLVIYGDETLLFNAIVSHMPLYIIELFYPTITTANEAIHKRAVHKSMIYMICNYSCKSDIIKALPESYYKYIDLNDCNIHIHYKLASQMILYIKIKLNPPITNKILFDKLYTLITNYENDITKYQEIINTASNNKYLNIQYEDKTLFYYAIHNLLPLEIIKLFYPIITDKNLAIHKDILNSTMIRLSSMYTPEVIISIYKIEDLKHINIKILRMCDVAPKLIELLEEKINLNDPRSTYEKLNELIKTSNKDITNYQSIINNTTDVSYLNVYKNVNKFLTNEPTYNILLNNAVDRNLPVNILKLFCPIASVKNDVIYNTCFSKAIFHMTFKYKYDEIMEILKDVDLNYDILKAEIMPGHQSVVPKLLEYIEKKSNPPAKVYTVKIFENGIEIYSNEIDM